MNITDIQTFLMIVNTRNITRTSKNLFISQPTVSRRLKMLESEVGCPLIRREKGEKQIELTPAGERFVPLAERWMSLQNEMSQIQQRDFTACLSVGATDTFNSCIMLPFYEYLWGNRKEHRMDLDISTHYSKKIYELLENREIDIGFVYHYLDFKNITAEPVLMEEMFLVQRDDEMAIRKPYLKTDELDPEREIYLSWEMRYEIWHNQWIAKGAKPTLTIDSYDLLLHLLKTPGAWAIVPWSVVRRLQKENPVLISRITNDVQPPGRITYFIRNKFESASGAEAIGRFLDLFREYIRKNFSGQEESIHLYDF